MAELQVRDDCRSRLAEIIKEQAAYWKQHSKQRAIKGDSNTAFHHAQATSRLRRNSICHIEVDGVLVANHETKVNTLTKYFSSILGTAGSCNWGFDVTNLFVQSRRPSDALTAPFTESEAKAAVLSMNRNSAPGPDGFGPSFYRAAWPNIKKEVMDLLNSFHGGDVDLERINRSYMVLLPKKLVSVTVDSFRPICLQNCSIKIIAKIMTQRLQREISEMIDSNQTGFLKGRSISEFFFVFAAEIVQCCHKKKVPALAVKLDFAKAFDMVNWEGMQTVLRARGFNDLWCTWIKNILQSSKSAVLVNGCPGPWIACKCGLRQGDPCHPTFSCW